MLKGLLFIAWSISIVLSSENVFSNGHFYSEEDIDLMCKTVFCESNTQDFDTQYMVALTIINRFQNGNMGETIREVIYYPNAYSVTKWNSFEQTEYNETTLKAVLKAIQENNHPHDMYYFRTEHYHRFGAPYMQSDDLYFSTEN